MSNSILGKIALFSFVLLGMVAISAPSVLAAGDTNTIAGQANQADTKTKTTTSASKPKHKKKRKRHHARKSTANSTKKS